MRVSKPWRSYSERKVFRKKIKEQLTVLKKNCSNEKTIKED